jgi:hypothetical protein
LAPGSFSTDIVVAQLSRIDVTRVPVWTRLQTLAGLGTLKPAAHVTIAVLGAIGLAVGLGCVLATWWRTRRAPPALEAFAWLTAAVVFAAVLWPPDYYPHYAWFFAPFIAVALGLSVSRSAQGVPRAGALLALAAAALAGVAGARQFHELSTLRSGDPTPFVRQHTQAGACVLTDLPPVTILSNRFVSNVPGCSRMVDPIGTSYALSHGRNGVTGAGRNATVRAQWRAAFAAAQYVWLQCGPSTRPQCLTFRRVPWIAGLERYFSQRFAPVPGQGARPSLFVRRGASTR